MSTQALPQLELVKQWQLGGEGENAVLAGLKRDLLKVSWFSHGFFA